MGNCANHIRKAAEARRLAEAWGGSGGGGALIGKKATSWWTD